MNNTKNRWFVAGIAIVLAGSTCGMMNRNVKSQSLGNGEFRLECQGSLSRCLDEADNLCLGSRYEVLTAKDTRDYYGPAGLTETEIRTSEALIRCGRRGRALFGEGGAGGSAGASGHGGAGGSAEIAKAAPARVCVPGATQVCVGSGACAGGQTCLPDGTGFGTCDCGPSIAKPAGSSNPVPSVP